MIVTIHDVGHGLCVSLVHDNGNVMLWDCGHHEQNRPSVFLPDRGIQRIDHFFVTNYDEDHISDLPNLRTEMSIRLLCRNRSISGEQLRRLKQQSGPISKAMGSMLDMIRTYTGSPTAYPEFPRVQYSTFCNNYRTDFSDTNNISLVTFLEFGTVRLIIPGDLEVVGWKHLLNNNQFKSKLSSVNVFLASHHGRENGYCAEVFRICRPDVVVFSDSPIKYATQEMASIYARHASGVNFNGERRHVISTRKDGSVSWNV